MTLLEACSCCGAAAGAALGVVGAGWVSGWTAGSALGGAAGGLFIGCALGGVATDLLLRHVPAPRGPDGRGPPPEAGPGA